MSRLSRSTRDRIYRNAAAQALSRMRQFHTRAELATMLGASIWALRSWEKGRRQPSGTVQMAILMLEGVLSDWPAGKLQRDDWREKLWGYPITAILSCRKRESNEDETENYFRQFEASSPEAKTAIIRNWENWVEQLKEISRSGRLKADG